MSPKFCPMCGSSRIENDSYQGEYIATDCLSCKVQTTIEVNP